MSTMHNLTEAEIRPRYAGKCQIYDGPKYQEYALRSYVEGRDQKSVLPWIWFTPACGTQGCVYFKHLNVAAPRKLAYPALVCIYCGMPGGTKDHLLPAPFTGAAQRAFVLVVPACAECNVFINDLPEFRIGERRRVAHERIAKKYAKFLRPVADFREMEGNLRRYVQGAHKKAGAIRARLAWPEDPNYDLRAFQKAGIEDPYEAGLI